jgi:Phage baseplate assembly protein W
MAGMCRHTGRLLTGWDEIKQSILMILTTAVGSRILRRAFGSGVPDILDKPMNEMTMVDVYVAVVEALEPHVINDRQYGEPRFVLTAISSYGDESGLISFSLSGIEFPRGHLGDFSAYTYRTFTVDF